MVLLLLVCFMFWCGGFFGGFFVCFLFLSKKILTNKYINKLLLPLHSGLAEVLTKVTLQSAFCADLEMPSHAHMHSANRR